MQNLFYITPIKGLFPQGMDGTLHVTTTQVLINGVPTASYYLPSTGGILGAGIWDFQSILVDTGATLGFQPQNTGFWTVIGCATDVTLNGSGAISTIGTGRYQTFSGGGSNYVASPTFYASPLQLRLAGETSLSYTAVSLDNGGPGGTGNNGGSTPGGAENSGNGGGGGGGYSVGLAASIDLSGAGGDGGAPVFSGGGPGVAPYGANGISANPSFGSYAAAGGSGGSRGAHASGLYLVVLGQTLGTGSLNADGQTGGHGAHANGNAAGGGGGGGGSGGAVILKHPSSGLVHWLTINGGAGVTANAGAGGAGGTGGYSSGAAGTSGNSGTEIVKTF